MFQLRNVQVHGSILQELKRGQRRDIGGIKRSWRLVSPQPASHNRYSVLNGQNKTNFNHHIEREVGRTLKPLREVWLNIGLERVDTHQGVSVKALLDSGATGLFISKKLAEKQGF